MKHNKTTYLVTSLVLLFTFSIPSQAENTDGYGKDFQDKLGHGVANMALGFSEIPKNIINVTDDSGILLGVTWGALRGVGHGVGRTLMGVAEFLTSPFPTGDYVAPGLPWERFTEDTRYFKAAFPGHWKSFGNESNLVPLGTDEGDLLRLE
jgi:putative exosortase-associated protein (TIGR04073 family)